MDERARVSCQPPDRTKEKAGLSSPIEKSGDCHPHIAHA